MSGHDSDADGELHRRERWRREIGAQEGQHSFTQCRRLQRGLLARRRLEVGHQKMLTVTNARSQSRAQTVTELLFVLHWSAKSWIECLLHIECPSTVKLHHHIRDAVVYVLRIAHVEPGHKSACDHFCRRDHGHAALIEPQGRRCRRSLSG